MGKIFCEYNILNQKDLYGPADEIEGILYIRSEEKKVKKLKKVQVNIVEKFDQYQVHATTSSTRSVHGTGTTPQIRSTHGIGSSYGTGSVHRVGPLPSSSHGTVRTSGHMTGRWIPRKKVMKKVIVAEKDVIEPDETKEYPFKFKLPNQIRPRTGKAYSNWHLVLEVKQKSGVVSSKGADKDSGVFIIPVKGWDQSIPTETPNIQGNVGTTNEEESQICSECGKVIKKGAKFCEHCGGANF